MAPEFKDDSVIRAMRFDGWSFIPLVLNEDAPPRPASGERKDVRPAEDKASIDHQSAGIA